MFLAFGVLGRRFAVTVAIAALFASPLASQAARPTGSATSHTVGPHLFIPSSGFPDPFIASHARSLIGAGFAGGLEVPIFNGNDSIVRILEGDMSFLQIDVEYQQRLSDWLALRVGVTGLARSGTETSTLLSEGLAAVYGMGLGATARIWGNDKFLLSGALDTRSNQLFGMTPLEYVQGVVQAVQDALQSVADSGITIDSAVVDSVLDALDLDQYTLFESEHASATTGGLRLAFAPTPWLGIVGLAQSGVTGIFNGASDKGLVDLGVAASVDLLPLWRVPIGANVSLRWQNASDRGSEVARNATAVGVGIAYTGRGDFSVALEAAFASFDQRQTADRGLAKRFGLAMRYYF